MILVRKFIHAWLFPVLMFVAACTPALPHRPRAQSWDQENLHSLAAHGGLCPNAIFTAPNGVLEQCE